MNQLKYIFKLLALMTLLCYLSISYGESTINPTLSFKIKGITSDELDNVEKQLAIERKSYGETLSEKSIQSLYQQGPDIIAQALQPYGYFNPTVRSNLSHDKQKWIAEYEIDLGKGLPIQVININIIGPGKNNPALVALKEDFPLKPGIRFTTKRYQTMQDYLFAAAHNQGYIKAKLTEHQVNVNLEHYGAKVTLTLDTGNLYYFGAIDFKDTEYSAEFLQKFLPFKSGDVYSSQQIQKVQSSLVHTKFFSSVNVSPKIPDDDSDKVPVDIHVNDAPRQEYKFGIGYGTNTGARTSVGVDIRRITDSGQHLSSILNLSEVNTSLNTTYFIPGPQPERNQFTESVSIRQFDPSGGNSYARQFASGFETSLASIWHLSSSINYLHERFQISDDPYDTVDMFYPEIYAARIKTNDPINPNKGTMIGLRARGSTNNIGPTNFAQGELTTKWIHPITGDSSFIFRGNLGITDADTYAEIPLTLRFFAGGPSSVRGYGDQDLGPGKYLKVASIEVQHRLYENYFGSIFLDKGTATNDFHESMKEGIGVGLIWHSAVGPIALYVAQAASEEDRPMRVELSLGAGI